VADFEGGRTGRGRRAAWTAGILLLALFFIFLPAQYQAPVRSALRATVMRPFIALQARLASARPGGSELAAVRAQRDSLVALLASQAALVEENRRLRHALGLHERIGERFIPARVLRVGLDGAESTFLIDVGAQHGVAVGSPVLAVGGLLGVVREVSGATAQAIDWTHPEFRASAMTDDGVAYGIVEPRAGVAREEDVLLLTGAPFHVEIGPGRRILTSGRGDLYPRGVPIGTVVGMQDADTGWRKSFIVAPAVRPEGLTHVLVGVGLTGGLDLTDAWLPPEASDTTLPALPLMVPESTTVVVPPDTAGSAGRP
jgi:rod shape-determining protein MreC